MVLHMIAQADDYTNKGEIPEQGEVVAIIVAGSRVSRLLTRSFFRSFGKNLLSM